VLKDTQRSKAATIFFFSAFLCVSQRALRLNKPLPQSRRDMQRAAEKTFSEKAEYAYLLHRDTQRSKAATKFFFSAFLCVSQRALRLNKPLPQSRRDMQRAAEKTSG
jgi:hypothetical protein